MYPLNKFLSYVVFAFAALLPVISFGQERPIRGGRPSGNLPGPLSNIGGRSFGSGGAATGDSLQHRDYSEDSVAITFRIPSSAFANKLDTSIRDFTTRFPIPAHHVFLGNLGTATRSFLFDPEMKSGWDPGFHAFDVYKWKPESVRFFNTTKPYTELNYMLGSRVEQMIEVMHTQNIRPHWNALMQYRLINSPGFFKNQKTNHNNYLFTSWYQSVNKRYNNYFVLLGNKLQSGENGGFKNDKDYLNDPVYEDRFNIPTRLGGDQSFGTNFFSTVLTTGNRYKEFTVMLRQQYDLGRKDSLVTDTTVIPLFYPRLRFEHTVTYNTYKYQFIDYLADSAYYHETYNMIFSPGDSVSLLDSWKEISNEFSIYQFPDANNLQQFIKLGAGLQNLRGSFDFESKNFYNFYAQAEYRNKTKNQKWDMVLNGRLYVNGLNSGDYTAVAGLRRIIPKSGSYLELGFRNTNRTPSFLFDNRSSFYIDGSRSFQKENTTHLSASVFHPRAKLKLSGNYYLISNYTYFTEYYKPQQENALFNVLQVSVEKVFRLGKNFNWYSDIYFQQKTGGTQLNLPLVFTRQRIALEGHFFKNLNLSTGFEGRYHTPYKADNYSPVFGRFFYQDSVEISNLPDISFFIHLRIRTFKAYFRIENLNAVSFDNGFAFRNNNFAAPGYIYPGLLMRLGIFWNFVN